MWRFTQELTRLPYGYANGVRDPLQGGNPLNLFLFWGAPENGGAERDRTADLVIANDALSQLSYSPVPTGLVCTKIGMEGKRICGRR